MKHIALLVNFVLIASMLTACGGAAEPEVVEDTPQVVEQQATQAVEVEESATAAPGPEPEAEPEPAVGGTLVHFLSNEMDTLDPHKSGYVFFVCQYIGGSLITIDPGTGDYIPYLAESWEIAEDGLEYVFHLREDIKFHDGTPLTAQDYAWTFNRAKDPTTKSTTSGPQLRGLAFADAVDDHTLRLQFAWPSPTFMNIISDPCYHQPFSQAYVEEMGEDYGRHPIGVGPFKLKEWMTGDKIVLERNPDFTWGPGYTRGESPYIETIEFRILPEYATQLAGLEAGEVDYIRLQSKDIERIEDTGQFQIVMAGQSGSGMHVVMNSTQPPFDDVRVRQAVNHAVNREALIMLVEHGYADPLYGPISHSTIGYWSGVEDIGYRYDLEAAQALMAEAGYTLDGDGWLEKDGQRLTVNMKAASNMADQVKIAEILQEQLKALGVQVEIQQLDLGIIGEELASGNFDMAVEILGYKDFGIMFAMFHSSMIGAWNRSRVDNMNEMIDAAISASSWELALQGAEAAQRHIVEQAYFIPLYSPLKIGAVSNRVNDIVFSTKDGFLYLFDAYIETSVP